MKNMKKPFALVINGPVGSGKTTLANTLRRHLKKTDFLGIDEIKYFLNSYERFNYKYNNISRDAVIAMSKTYVKNGFNVVISSSWPSPYFKKLKTALPKIKIIPILLTIPLEESIRRVRSRGGFYPIEKIKRNHKFYSVQKNPNTIVIDTYKKSIYTVKKEILAALKKDLGLVKSI